MGVKKVTGIGEIDSLIAGLNKYFGTEVITNRKFEVARPCPTGSMQLDSALRIGGFPMGRIIEIYGPESSGKTSLGLQMLANWQKNAEALGQSDRIACVIDVEGSISDEFMETFGIDTDRVLRIPDPGVVITAEQALHTIRELPNSGKIGYILYDSVGGTQKLKQMEKKVGENDMGGISKLMHDALRKLSKTSRATETTCVFINHLTYDPGAMGDPRTTPGGNALKFFSSLRLMTMKLKESDVAGNFLMRIKIVKTKIGNPWGKDPVTLDFTYAHGVDPVVELYTFSKKLGVARQASSAFKCDLDGDGEKTITSGGVAGAIKFLRENTKVREKLYNLCMATAGVVAPEVPVDDNSESVVKPANESTGSRS